MYMRVGAVTGLLDATYRGPYCVLVRERKKLLLEIGATRQWVSVDCLKPHTAPAAQRWCSRHHLDACTRKLIFSFCPLPLLRKN